MRFALVWLAVLGCRQGAPVATNDLVGLVDEPAGENCVAGGVAIQTGPDSNHNGVLDAEEVTQTAYVCDPVVPAGALVEVAPEPAGQNCIDGGTVIRTGADTDGSGTLDTAEVTGEQYVCVPVAGAGQLVEVATEDPGANCAAGGLAVNTGIDDDLDGDLSSTEVDHTEYLCADEGVLIDVEELEAGDGCAAGGFRIRTGHDDDGDGTLDVDEVADLADVCHGLPAPVALYRVDREDPGQHCATGGVAIGTGVDDSGDGLLQVSEVDLTSYVCDGDAGHPALVVASTADAGHCPAGGLRIDSGVDLDDDASLAPGEITHTDYVCDGEDGTNGDPGATGKTTLVRLDDAGANCANGGTAVRSGVDDSGDGTLQDPEIDHTRYVCDGTPGDPGDPGDPGATALIGLDPEDPGPNCTYGGTRITTGLDLDDSGTLDAQEITATQYACNAGSNDLPVIALTAEGQADASHAASGGTYTTVPDMDVRFDTQGDYVVLTRFDFTLYPGSASAWAALRLNVDGNPDAHGTHAKPAVAGEERHLTLFRIDAVSAGSHVVKAEWGEGAGTVSNLAGNTSYVPSLWTRRLSVLAIPAERGVKYAYKQGTTDVCRTGTAAANWTAVPDMSTSVTLSERSVVLTLFDMNAVGSGTYPWWMTRLTVNGSTDGTNQAVQNYTPEVDSSALFRIDVLDPGTRAATAEWGYGQSPVCNNASGSDYTRRIGMLAIPLSTGVQSSYVVPISRATHAASGSTYTVIPGMTTTVGASGDGFAAAWTEFVLSTDPASNGAWVASRLSFDGYPDAHSVHTHPNTDSEDNMVGSHRLDIVTPGLHTVAAEWGEGAGSPYCDTTGLYWTRRLGVLTIPITPP